MRRVLLLVALAATAWAAPAGAQPADPPWVGTVVGEYGGSIRNEGLLECHRTQFTLRDGHLVGHYDIDAKDPLAGELLDFVPETPDSGRFTWSDRYGTGVMFVVFALDRSSFTGAWGNTTPEMGNTVWGQRGGTAGCGRAVS